MKISVTVSAAVHPTEILKNVEKAILNFFPVDLELQDGTIPVLYGEGGLESLRTLHLHLRKERILDTARNIFLHEIEGNAIKFQLNKQVAFIGKLNFPASEESLGSINVTISAQHMNDLLNVIDWLAPCTVDGKPVMEMEL